MQKLIKKQKICQICLSSLTDKTIIPLSNENDFYTSLQNSEYYQFLTKYRDNGGLLYVKSEIFELFLRIDLSLPTIISSKMFFPTLLSDAISEIFQRESIQEVGCKDCHALRTVITKFCKLKIHKICTNLTNIFVKENQNKYVGASLSSNRFQNSRRKDLDSVYNFND